MAIRVIPNFEGGAVDQFSPEQTIGQFANGANDITQMQRKSLDLATERIAFDKLKALAPLAKAQAAKELEAHIMQSGEYMDPRTQANRMGTVVSGNRKMGIFDFPEPPAGVVPQQGVPGINEAIQGPPAATVAPGAPPAGSEDINNAMLPPAAPFPEPGASLEKPPAAPGLNEAIAGPSRPPAVAAKAIFPEDMPTPIGGGYVLQPAALDREKAKERAEKVSDAIAVARAKIAGRPGAYEVFKDKAGGYHYIQKGAAIPDGLTPVSATSKSAGSFHTVTDGNGHYQDVRRGDPIPDGWKPWAPSTDNADARELVNRMSIARNRMKDADKLLATELPDDMKQQALAERISARNAFREAAIASGYRTAAEFDQDEAQAEKEMAASKPAPEKVQPPWYERIFNAVASKLGGGSAAPKAAPAVGGGDRVRVKSPDGTIGSIPKSQLDEALKKNYSRVD